MKKEELLKKSNKHSVWEVRGEDPNCDLGDKRLIATLGKKEKIC